MAILIMNKSWWFAPHLIVVLITGLLDAIEDAKQVIPNMKAISIQDSYKPVKKNYCAFSPTDLAALEQKPVIVEKKSDFVLPKKVPKKKL